MKDKTRAMVDELGHLWVKDALEHALKMKYALLKIRPMCGESIEKGVGVDYGVIDAIDDALNDR